MAFTRYIIPLCEGELQPEADDGFRYTVILRSAGHGPSEVASPPHPGHCDDLDTTLERLFPTLV